jgi:hypothetical protein
MSERCAWISGNEFRVKEALDMLKDHLGQSPEGITVHGSDTTVQYVKGHMLSAPFDRSYVKLIVLRGLPKDHGDLAPFIKRIPKTNYLAIIDKAQTNFKLYKEIAKRGKIVKLDPPSNTNELQDWIIGRFTMMKKKISKPTTEILIEICGSDLMILNSEITKICRYVTKPTITEEDIKEVAVVSGSGDIWAFMSAIENRDYEECIKTWRRASNRMESGEMISIPNLIIWKMRMVMMAKSMFDRGGEWSNISKTICSLSKLDKAPAKSTVKTEIVTVGGKEFVRKAMYNSFNVQQAMRSPATKKYSLKELQNMYMSLYQLLVSFRKTPGVDYRQRDMEIFLMEHVKN